VILRDHGWLDFRTPRWFIGKVVLEPSESQSLVLLENIFGEMTYIYGYYIYASEENEFSLWWRWSGKHRSITISLPGPGTVIYANSIPINIDSPNIEGNFGIDVLYESSPGSFYQAGILATGCTWPVTMW